MVRIEELDLSQAGRLTLGQNGFRAFDNLKKLIATNSSLTRLEDRWFGTNSKVEYLDLSHNQLDALRRDNFRTLRRMRFLYLVDNSIASMETNNFVDLANLEVLDMRNNRLNALVEIGSLQRMRSIDYSENGVTDVNILIIPSSS